MVDKKKIKMNIKMKMKKLDDPKAIKIFANAYRREILNIFNKAEKPLTVKEIADKIKEQPSKVHYHVKQLINIDLLDLDHTDVINGIVAKYYKPKYEVIKIDVSQLSSDLYVSNSDIIVNTFSKYSEHFKEEISNHIENVRALHKAKQDPLMMRMQSLHMNDDEYKEFIKHMDELIQKYSTKKEDTNEYSVIFGAIRTK
jgi:predicted transcriptional regulator